MKQLKIDDRPAKKIPVPKQVKYPCWEHICDQVFALLSLLVSQILMRKWQTPEKNFVLDEDLGRKFVRLKLLIKRKKNLQRRK